MASPMDVALAEGALALAAGEVPVGCVIVDNATGAIVARGANRCNALGNATAHAEIVALRSLTSTLAASAAASAAAAVAVAAATRTPCIMCAAAIAQFRPAFTHIVYGCANPKFGGCGSIVPLAVHPPPVPELVPGVQAAAAVRLLRAFYAASNPNAPRPKRKKHGGGTVATAAAATATGVDGGGVAPRGGGGGPSPPAVNGASKGLGVERGSAPAAPAVAILQASAAVAAGVAAAPVHDLVDGRGVERPTAAPSRS
ncbi:hypothetical protein MMPV_004213 [Pyropia vietnamensis]